MCEVARDDYENVIDNLGRLDSYTLGSEGNADNGNEVLGDRIPGDVGRAVDESVDVGEGNSTQL
jgi:hypothetical protein